jgi:hypothetical protein
MTLRTSNRHVSLAALAAAVGLMWLAAPALACGPNMGGGSPSGGGPPSGGGNPRPGSDSYSNTIGAERMREGAADAAGDEGQNDGAGSLASGPSGGANPNQTSAIAALAAAQQSGGGGLGQPPVWCLMQRQGPNGNAEQTVIRCDDTAGAGPGWMPVAGNLTFTAASAMRDGFNSGNQPLVWCLMQRQGPTGAAEHTVIRCDNAAGAGPGWMPMASNMTFTAASAIRDSLNAANRP